MEIQFVDSPIDKEEKEVRPGGPETGQKEDVNEKLCKYFIVTVKKFGQSFVST